MSLKHSSSLSPGSLWWFQVNFGINQVQSPELRCGFAGLNETAGIKAVRCNDFVNSRLYFKIALSFLPAEHWQSHYDRRCAKDLCSRRPNVYFLKLV